jgi:hypothetical protein
VKKELT